MTDMTRFTKGHGTENDFVLVPDLEGSLELTPAQVREERFPAYEAFYDDETRRLVRECFAADFEAYGYDNLTKRVPESADRLEPKKPAVPGIHHILG